MITRGPADRVASILDFIRPHVDEIVVAADAAGDEALEGLRGNPADKVVWFDSPGTLESVLPWALRQCSADWLLRIDDDEVPSLRLIEELRGSDGEATHALVPLRWLWPTADSFWASPPLGQNHRLRVCRNMPGLWRQDPGAHHDLEVLGSHRVLTGPIYHGVSLLLDEQDRRDKAARYEAMTPGLLMEDLPTNALYVPEDVDGIQVGRVEPEDVDAIAAMLATRSIGTFSRRTATVPSSELLSWTTGPVLDAAHEGSVRIVEPPREMATGCAHSLLIEVTNGSLVGWPSERIADSPIRVAVEWMGIGPMPRVLLPCVIPPGASRRIHTVVVAPEHVGPWRLNVRLVHEYVAWFGDGEEVTVDIVERATTTPPFRARRAW